MLVSVIPGTFNGNLEEPWLLKQCLSLALPLESKLSKDKYNDEYYEKDEIPGWHRRTSPLVEFVLAQNMQQRRVEGIPVDFTSFEKTKF
jgi:hypothetical protein